jgi:hypothetical protein
MNGVSEEPAPCGGGEVGGRGFEFVYANKKGGLEEPDNSLVVEWPAGKGLGDFPRWGAFIRKFGFVYANEIRRE